jgi:diguanylate cyclase (GGDEF)-like protein/PAS domain S-box-containing protein
MIDKIKRFFWNIVSSNLPTDYDLEALRKIFLLNMLSILGIFFLGLLGTITIIEMDYILGAVDFTILAFLVVLFSYLRKTKKHELAGMLGTITIGIFYFYLVAYGGINNTAYVWAFTYPLISLFLLGTKLGSLTSLLLIGMICVVFMLGTRVPFFTTYSTDLSIRYVSAYMIIYLFSYVMEKVRSIVQNRLETTNIEIEKALEKVKDKSIQLAESNEGLQIEIAERRKVENALKESEKRFRSLFEESMDAIVNTDKKGNLLLVNPAGMALFGLTDAEVASINFRELYVDPEMARRFTTAVREKGHIRDFGVQLRGKDGKIMDCLMTVITKKSNDGALMGYEGIIRDVTPYKKMEEELRQLATIDSLTGINNRRNFLDLAQKEISRSSRYDRPFSIVMLDIDHFKKVNDTYGHSVGDKVLVEFCTVCLKQLRENDIMGRLGGEEFAVALVECDPKMGAIFAERIRQAVAAHVVRIGREEIRFTVSLGVTSMRQGCNLDSMLERADNALYKAKENGRNQVQSVE